MVALRERREQFQNAGATPLGGRCCSPVLARGISRGTRDRIRSCKRHEPEWDSKFDLERDIEEVGLHGVANRAVFVLDEDGPVMDNRVAEDPTNELEYETIPDAADSISAR